MNSLYKGVVISEDKKLGTGWLPPMPDMRDYSVDHPNVKDIAKKLGIPSASKKSTSLPKKVDLRKWCSPVENQEDLGSCTAHAAIGVVEYFQIRAYDKHINGSRLFVYKATRNLMGVVGDTGAWLRNAMGALVLCGVPPEKYWPYTTVKEAGPEEERTFDDEPPSFVYAVADNYETLNYFCHDPQGAKKAKSDVLTSVKKYVAAGIPSIFGFFGFPSFPNSNVPGGIPYPCSGEQAEWGHAIVAVGYDDDMKVKNTKCNKETKGALLIRNSWGTGWGDKGYGWLPYDYVLDGLAVDFWSLVGMDYVDTAKFGF